MTVVGRPNVGKSTLVNSALGAKVTITSARPNTTRRVVRGVLHRPGVQAIFVDTPGIHRPRSALGKRLDEALNEALSDVDVVVALLDATAEIGPGDRLVLDRAVASTRANGKLLVAVNKVDRARREQVLEQLSNSQQFVESRQEGELGVEYFPVSAKTGRGIHTLVEAIVGRLPEGPPYFPEDMISDMAEAVWVAELVREQLLARLRDEVPHSIATRVSEWDWPVVRVEIVVERESQRGIVIGRGGEVLKEVGTAVREQMRPGAFLELHVGVEKRWQQRPDAIERFGY